MKPLALAALVLFTTWTRPAVWRQRRGKVEELDDPFLSPVEAW